MHYINIKFLMILPILLYGDDFTPPVDLISFDKDIEINTTLLNNREILNYLSIDENLKNYKNDNILKLRNKLDMYLKSSESHLNSKINQPLILANNVTIDTSEIINNVEIEEENSNIENSNTEIIIEQDIHNSIIENEVNVINSDVHNSNLGIQIGVDDSNFNSSNTQEEKKSNSTLNGNTIINHVHIHDSNIKGENNNFGISIGN